MAAEQLDPAYKYVDDKIKLIKREIQQLKEAHDAVAAQQQSALLRTQRFLANSNIAAIHNLSLDEVWDRRPKKYEAAKDEFGLQTADAIAKVGVSNEPLSIADDFRHKRFTDLKKMGIPTVKIPDY